MQVLQLVSLKKEKVPVICDIVSLNPQNAACFHAKFDAKMSQKRAPLNLPKKILLNINAEAMSNHRYPAGPRTAQTQVGRVPLTAVRVNVRSHLPILAQADNQSN